jgi:hypothetical protein
MQINSKYADVIEKLIRENVEVIDGKRVLRMSIRQMQRMIVRSHGRAPVPSHFHAILHQLGFVPALPRYKWEEESRE